MAVLYFRNEKGEFVEVPTLQGPSAYEVAVANGFEGTEAEWLASLKPKKGVDYWTAADKQAIITDLLGAIATYTIPAGTYVCIETPEMPADKITAALAFESNGASYTALAADTLGIYYGQNKTWAYEEGAGWVDELDRTITVTAAIFVSPDFYAWFMANYTTAN